LSLYMNTLGLAENCSISNFATSLSLYITKKKRLVSCRPNTLTSHSPYEYKLTYNYTYTYEDRVPEITGTLHGSVGNGHVIFLLWL
jgi:hypothetical protein